MRSDSVVDVAKGFVDDSGERLQNLKVFQIRDGALVDPRVDALWSRGSIHGNPMTEEAQKLRHLR